MVATKIFLWDIGAINYLKGRSQVAKAVGSHNECE